MKNLNFLSNLCGLGRASQSTDVSLDCRLTVGSPSGLDAKWKQNPFMRFAVVLTLIFTIGSGNVWGAVAVVSYNEDTQDTNTAVGSSNISSGSAGRVSWSATSATWNSSKTRWDWASGSSVTFTVSSGYVITEIETYTTSTKGTFSVSPTATITGNGTATCTISGLSASSVTITTSGNHYIKDGYVHVTYEESTPAEPHTVRFYTASASYTDIEEASVGAGVTPPVMSTPCDGWAFQGWSTSYSNSTTSTTVLSTVTLTTGKYYPSNDVTLYPVYTKSGGTAFSSYSLVSLGGTITSGKYIVSTGSYSKNNSTANGGGSVSPSTTEQTSYELTITSYSTYFTIQLSGGNYLGATNGTTIQSTANKASDANYQWTYNSNGIYCSNQSRYMRANATSDFRNYKTNNNYSGSTQAKLYKRNETTITYYYSYPACCTDPELAYATGSVTKTFGASAFTNPLTNSHSVAVTYSSSDETVATVNSSGLVTIKKVGSTTITASSIAQTVEAVSYCADEASYTLTVNKANITPTLTYTPNSVAVGSTTSAPTVGGNTGSGGVTYSSSNPSVATVDENTGVVTGVATGSVTITATIAATTNYNGNTATATVTVTAASYFPQNKTLFFEAKTQGESAWKDGAQCKAWFRDCDSDCGEAPWTYWQTDGDSYKKYYAVVIPSTGNYPYVTIQRFSDYTGNTSWGEGGAQTYSTGGGSNVIKSTCASGACLSWSPTSMQIYLRGDITNDEWASNIGELTDQNGGIWSYTYNNYASDGSSLAFKLYTNYNTWIGNTSDNNNATLSGMNDGSTYNITATYNVVDHSLVMSKTFVKGEVSFDLQGHGAAISKLTNVAAGSKISAPSTPTDGSYIFGGWYKEPACTNAWDFANDVVNETMTLYAKWYQVTLVVKDDASATLSGDGKPTLTRSGASLTAATAGLYTFKDIQITSGTGTLSSTSSLTPTINSVSSNITVTATFWKPRTVTKGTGTGTSTFTLSATSVAYNGSMTITCAADATHKNPWTLTVTPSDGATYSSSGSAGSITISNITKNITVDLAYTAKSTATLKIEVAGSESTIPGTRYEGDSYTLPSTAADCPDMGFYGWYKGTYSHATTAPTGTNFYLPGATATLTGGENKFYAVYAEMNETANTYTKITTTDQLVTGDYLIVAYFSSSYIEAMANTVNSSDYMDEVQMKTFVNSTSNPTTINLGSDNPAIRWRITNNGNTVNFYNAAVNKYFSTGTGTPTLANSAEEFSYSVSSGRWSFVYDNTYLIYTTNYYVGNTEDKPIYLFKRDVTAENFTTSPSCVTHDLTVVASPDAGGSAEAVLTVLGEGKTTTATATPNSHYTFSHWTISGTEATMSNTVDNKSTDNPVTVTMGTADATLTAHFTEKEKCTVVFKNNGGIESSDTYWLGENPVAPLLTDGVSNDACDATSDKHYGWTRNLITGNVADQATLDARTGSDVVYTKAATLPAITAGDDGTTITYHAVWAQATGSGSGNYELVEEDLGTEWAGDYLIAYSSTIFADGRVGGKDAAGSIGAQSTHVTPGDNLSANEKVVAASWGDTYYITLEEISENSNTYVLKTQDDVYNYQSSNNNGLASTDNKATAANYPITVNFESSSDIELALGGGAAGAIFHYNTSSLGSGGDVFRYYKNGGQAAIYLYKKMGGTTYSTFLTTCCEYAVNLTGDVSDASDHCTSIAFSNATIETCSSDGTNRRVTVTVTPNAGYEGPTALGYSGDGTADKKSGPTDNGNGTYSYVYEFAQEDDGDGTFTATCTAKTYRITFDQTGATTTGTAYVDVVFNSALPAIPSLPEKTDYNFAGYYTAAEDGTQFVGSTGTWYTVSNWINSDKEWIKADNKTLYPHWTEKSLQNYRTHCPSFAVYNQDGTSAADIHLTSTKDVEIYASQATGNLIRIIASGLDANGTHPKIGVEYYDANNGDALVTGTDRVFRLCSSSTYNVEDDLLDLGENTTEYDQKFSISYTPKDYNQSHHYKLKLILRNNNTEKDNVTIHLYGRSLPKEFVIAAKSGDTWYALPNTLAATEGAQGAISPTAITVDNATTPTKAVNPIGTVIYGACNRYTNDNRSGLRFTSDGAHWAQTSATTSVYKMWLSNTGYTNAQDWYLKSSDLTAYEVFMDPIGSPDDKRRIELYNSSGVKMGYHNTGSGNARTGIGNIYLLPVEFPSMEAGIMEWGTDHVVVELRTPGSSTKVKTQIGGGAIGDEQSLASVKKDEGVYRLAVSLSSSDALKDLKLYFYNISDVLQGVAEFTIPRIVSSTTTTGAFGTAFKKDAPFVDLVILNGATLTVSETTTGTKFTFRDLYIYGGGKMVVPAGTYIDFSNVYMRGGHLNSSWNYVYSHPQLVLNGTMGNTSNTINYDYLTNNAQFYSLALPYDVTLSTIVNPDFNNKQSWLIHAYDGALRASGSQVSGWYDVEEGSTEGDIDPLGSSDALTAGVGYTFFGAPQKVNSIRQKWSVNRFPMTLASGSAEVAKSGVSVTAHGMTESAGVYTLNDGVAPNDAGWNMLGNPFLADIGGTETYETAVKGTILSYHNVKTMDASGNWTGGWHWEENETNVRYVRIPNDLGTEYEQVRFKDATLRAFHHFFIQAGATGTFNFDLATRAQSMPQRIKRGKLLLPEEMDVDFRLSKGEASTKFGLTLCDDFSSDYVMNEDIAEDLSGEAMKAYTLILDQRVTYNGLPFTAAQQIIPVGFRAPNAGEYTFSYQEDENSENIEHIYLTDMRLGVVTDLKDNTYKFASEIGVIDNRFVLQIVFSSNVTTDVEETFEQENGRPLKFLYQGKIYILRNGILYDITGKRVREINK